MSSIHTHDLPSFSNEKFEAAQEQSRLLPLPTKVLLEKIRAFILRRVPFTAGGCQRELGELTELTIEIVDGGMFDASAEVEPLQLYLRDSREGKPDAIFESDFKKWKEGRATVKQVKQALSDLVKPFAKYAVEWENSQRGRAFSFGLRMNMEGGYYQGEWDKMTGLRNGYGVHVRSVAALVLLLVFEIFSLSPYVLNVRWKQTVLTQKAVFETSNSVERGV